jgi:hypothetical protein
LHIILDVCITCHNALDVQNVEQDESVANVLQRCGSDKLHEQLEELTKIVEKLGGRTRYTDDRENAATPLDIAAGTVKCNCSGCTTARSC